jgi:hypothetical protein
VITGKWWSTTSKSERLIVTVQGEGDGEGEKGEVADCGKERVLKF